MTAPVLAAIERARRAWERSQPQTFLDFERSAAPPYPPDAAGAADHRGGERPSVTTAEGLTATTARHAPRAAGSGMGTFTATPTRKD